MECTTRYGLSYITLLPLKQSQSTSSVHRERNPGASIRKLLPKENVLNHRKTMILPTLNECRGFLSGLVYSQIISISVLVLAALLFIFMVWATWAYSIFCHFPSFYLFVRRSPNCVPESADVPNYSVISLKGRYCATLVHAGNTLKRRRNADQHRCHQCHAAANNGWLAGHNPRSPPPPFLLHR